jgi:hypothetical protein
MMRSARRRIQLSLVPFMRLSIIALIALALFGCDARYSTQPTAVEDDDAPTEEFPLTMRIVTPIAPQRTTHVVVGALGNTYFTQESTRGDDVMFIMGEAEVPRATEVTAPKIVAAMGLPGGVGNIQSLAASPQEGGYIYFYFLGGRGKAPAACIGRFAPQTARVEIVADTTALQEASGMGLSLSLANGKLIAMRDRVWLWLRHTDRSVLLYVEPEPGETTLKLHRPFERVTDEDHRPMKLTRDHFDMCPGADGKLLLLDRENGILWRIGEDGIAVPVYSEGRLPTIDTEPACDRDGRVFLFAASFGPVLASEEGRFDKVLEGTDFPAMIVLSAKQAKVSVIQHRHWQMPQDYPVNAMKLYEMRPGYTPGSWITYDWASGNILRLRIRARE